MTDPDPIHAIMLHPEDDVAVALVALVPGEVAQIRTPAGTRDLTLAEAVPRYHKFSVTDLNEGANVRKSAEVIGRTTRSVSSGHLVHVDNLTGLRDRSQPSPFE